jgi:uncharacterized protein YaiI (UPF0178 family)
MQIWMDGDACPKPIKDILFRTAVRNKTLLFVVSNHALTTPPSPYIKRHQVAAGFDVADNHIIEQMEPGDLVITADIPLANDVVNKGGWALNPRGELYSINNMRQLLAQRNMNEALRGGGMISGGPPKFGPKEIQRFANQLDKFLAKKK